MAARSPRTTSTMERNKRIRDFLAFCLGILLVGGLIQAAGWLKGDRLVFPDVAEILRAFIRLLGEEKTWRQIATTLLHLAEALLLSAIIGTALGLAQGKSRFIRNLLRPLMILLRSIPMIVMTVIIMVLTRYEQVPLIASTLMLIPIISEATSEGLRRIEPELLDVYSSAYFNEYADIYAYALIMILLALLVSSVPVWAGKITEAIKRSHLQ